MDRAIGLWLIWGIITGLVFFGRAQGRLLNPWLWFFIGFFAAGLCGPFALLFMFAMPDNRFAMPDNRKDKSKLVESRETDGTPSQNLENDPPGSSPRT